MFPWQLFASAVSIVLVAVLSVSGVVTPQGYYHGMMVFESHVRGVGFEFGGLAVAETQLVYQPQHEYGHYLQEKMLGNMYVPVIGAGSVVGNIALLLRIPLAYKQISTERWADELGGVIGSGYGFVE